MGQTEPNQPNGTPEGEQPPLHPHAVYDRVGGMPAFVALVDAFYERVERDEVMRPMYPEDLEPGKHRLAMFFAQYWGGGDIYSREHGHPRLRMRHAPFPVSPDAAARWAQHMSDAIEEQGFDPQVRSLLLGYVLAATPTMINTYPDPPTGSEPSLPVHPR